MQKFKLYEQEKKLKTGSSKKPSSPEKSVKKSEKHDNFQKPKDKIQKSGLKSTISVVVERKNNELDKKDDKKSKKEDTPKKSDKDSKKETPKKESKEGSQKKDEK
jgi:hypothetical protein